jgi:F-type H+-transporting ATPase subunit b
MISLDISILYQVILFVVLWLIVNKVLFQPYLKLLDERERKTTGAQHDSTELEHEGARLRAQYEERIAQAQSVAAGERERILQSAREQREKILGQARQEAEQTLAGRRQEIATALVAERRLASAEAAIIAADIASKVLGRKVA